MKRLLPFFHPLITRFFWKSFFFVLLLASLFVLALLSGNFASWVLFYALLPIFCFMVVLNIYPYQTIELQRKFAQDAVYGGEDMDVLLILKKKWLLPFFAVQIEDDPDCPSAVGSHSGQAHRLSWLGREGEFHYTLKHLTRGHYQFSTVLLTTGDPFGFFRKQVRLQCTYDLVVYPAVFPVRFSDAEEHYLRHSDNREKDITQFSSVRAFQPSDRLSWLDWKATARLGEMVTKEFETERDQEALITLISSPRAEKVNFERALALAASLAAKIIKEHVALIINESADESPVRLFPSTQHSLQIVCRRLALLDQEQVPNFFVDVTNMHNSPIHFLITTEKNVLQEFSSLSHGRRQQLLVFYVTDEDGEGWTKQVQKMGIRSFVVTNDDFRHLKEAGEINNGYSV